MASLPRGIFSTAGPCSTAGFFLFTGTFLVPPSPAQPLPGLSRETKATQAQLNTDNIAVGRGTGMNFRFNILEQVEGLSPPKGRYPGVNQCWSLFYPF